MVKDYASQYCAAKSLPFTAGEMALDCVSVAFASAIPTAISSKAIANLAANGYKEEVCFANDRVLNIDFVCYRDLNMSFKPLGRHVEEIAVCQHPRRHWWPSQKETA